jgi:phosphatidate phosphatase APP1
LKGPFAPAVRPRDSANSENSEMKVRKIRLAKVSDFDQTVIVSGMIENRLCLP